MAKKTVTSSNGSYAAGTWTPLFIPIYVTAVVFAELVLVKVSVLAGVSMHAAVTFAAFTHHVLAGLMTHGRAAAATSVLPPIALVPLLRVIGTAVPLPEALPKVAWMAVPAVPLLLATFWAGRAMRADGTTLRFSFGRWPLQLLIGGGGAALGWAGYLMIRPGPVVRDPSMDLLALSIIVLIFAGFAEELVFRGIVQRSMERSIGGAAVLGTTVLFSAMYLGSQTLALFLFMSAAGFFFGAIAWKTRSTMGVAIAHGFTKVFLFVLGPLFL